MVGTILRVSVAAALLAAVEQTRDAPRGAFAIGVLRRDGIVIPFASFDGKRWRNDWPPPQRELTVPISIASVPFRWWGPTGPHDTWRVSIDGGAPRDLRVTQPDWAEVHCARQIGLRTDYVNAAAPPRTVQPYPKDGVAIAPAVPVDRIEIVPLDAPEIRAISPALLGAFNAAEREVESRYGHPIPRRSREGVEPTIEAVYAFGGSPRFYYVEATRAYRRLGEESRACAALAFGTGWFIWSGDTAQSLMTAVDLLNCDRNGASYMLPFGVARVGERLFWIAQFSGWDHERYVVVELTPKKIETAVSTWGGGC